MSHPESPISELNLPFSPESPPSRRVLSSSSDSSNASHLQAYHLPSSPPPEKGNSAPVIEHSSSPPTEVVLPPSSVLARIRHFLENDYYLGTKDFVQIITASEFHSFFRERENPSFFSFHQAKQLRIDYDSDTSTLTVKRMLTPVHEALAPTIGHIHRSIVSPTFLTARELDHHVRLHGAMDCALPARIPRSSTITSQKRLPSIKQPDAAYYYLDRSRGFPVKDAFPSIIFEVAFSQTHDSVVNAARQWILRSEGCIKLAVVIKLTEGPIIPSEDADHDSDASSDGEKYGSEFSCADGYNEFNLNCDPALWVGPINGFIELYRYDPVLKAVYRDGEQISFFPTLPQMFPCIKVTDFLRHLPDSDPRTYPIPLDFYVDEIIMAIRALALKRKALLNKQLKRKDRGNDDGEYTDRSQGDGDDEQAGEVEEIEVRSMKRVRTGVEG